MKRDPIVMVIIGDRVTQNYNLMNPVATTFKGPNAPSDAMNFIGEKFAETKARADKYRKFSKPFNRSG